jgi:hypothetical protein
MHVCMQVRMHMHTRTEASVSVPIVGAAQLLAIVETKWTDDSKATRYHYNVHVPTSVRKRCNPTNTLPLTLSHVRTLPLTLSH